MDLIITPSADLDLFTAGRPNFHLSHHQSHLQFRNGVCYRHRGNLKSMTHFNLDRITSTILLKSALASSSLYYLEHASKDVFALCMDENRRQM